jgi:hypothetical protein
MKTIESFSWRDKVTPSLLRRYDEAIASQNHLAEQVILEYWGNFSTLHLEVEILAAIDQQLQVSIALSQLPDLASCNRIKTIKLPSQESVVSAR